MQVKARILLAGIPYLLAFLTMGCGSSSSLPPPPKPDFKVSASSVSTLVQRGGISALVTVSVTGQNGFTSSVSISVEGLPPGVTSSPASPFSVAADASQPVNFSASTTAKTGNAAVTFRATSGALAHTVSTTLTVMQKSADPDALPVTRAVLQYLTDLADKPDGKKVISGQAVNFPERVPTYWDYITQTTRHTPGVLGSRYRYQDTDTTEFKMAEMAQVNARSIAHWNKKGFVALDQNDHNPVTGTGAAPAGFTQVEYEAVLTPGTSLNRAYLAFLDTNAIGYRQLQDAGVVILFRPLAEMNAPWTWYNHGTASQFVRLWKMMFHYLVNTKQLHNLLFVYAPASGAAGEIVERYPGDDYVDIVAVDYYLDLTAGVPIPKANGYKQLTELAPTKPFALGEFGPQVGDATQFIPRDYLQLINGIRQSMPRVTYWLSWINVFTMGQFESPPGVFWNHYNVDLLLSDPWVINLEDLPSF